MNIVHTEHFFFEFVHKKIEIFKRKVQHNLFIHLFNKSQLYDDNEKVHNLKCIINWKNLRKTKPLEMDKNDIFRLSTRSKYGYKLKMRKNTILGRRDF